MLILNQGALLWLQKLPKFLKYANISFKNKTNAFRWFHNMRLSSMTSSYNKKEVCRNARCTSFLFITIQIG